ncbi:MAG: ferredoxin [Actinomycetes bacterium]
MAANQHPVRLRVDPVACDGIGICTHLAPTLITVDSWGFPIVAGHPLSKRDRKSADAAIAACPRRALFLDDLPN